MGGKISEFKTRVQVTMDKEFKKELSLIAKSKGKDLSTYMYEAALKQYKLDKEQCGARTVTVNK